MSPAMNNRIKRERNWSCCLLTNRTTSRRLKLMVPEVLVSILLRSCSKNRGAFTENVLKSKSDRAAKNGLV